jgi:hypothetical protein
MAFPPAPSAFDIHHGDDQADAPPMGRLAIDDGGQITLLYADEDYEMPLRAIIEGVNELDVLRIKMPSESGIPAAITFQNISRDDPDLTDAILEFMKQKYDLLLEIAPGGLSSVTGNFDA